MYGHSSGASSSGSKSSGRQKRLYEDEYLERDDDEEEGAGDDMAYQPAPGSPATEESNKASSNQDEEDEDDPLDAFMADINQQAKKDKEASERHETEKEKPEKDDKKKLGRTDIDEEDMQESYFRFLDEQKAAAGDDDEIFEYDEDGNVIWTWKKVIDPLPSVDHATIDYAPFERRFYAEHSDISALNHFQTEQLRETLNIKTSGLNVPKPVTSFAHFGFDEQLMNAIRKSEYTQPTSIQAQAIPALLSGRDVIGIAKTGSGKTAAYLWPALVHIMHQPELQPGDGPIALIVVPTRELAIQVYHEAKKFGKVYNINVVCAYGGGSKWEQQNALTEGAEIVVATPGRIIDMVKMGATNFTRVTYLVFDEADRMFDMGFERQVRSIADHVRPDRQCLMFSATFKKRVERLAREQLNDAIRIVQGEIGEANEDIKQTVEVFATPPDKWAWLMERLVKFSTVGKVLIFVTRKQNSEELATNLKTRDMPVCLLHGDMQQLERNETISAFRKDIPILVATDVAARGLDIPEIRTVINYDVARDIDTHVHRIGRTGRAG
uniref:RNA helicase n=1 Tax=Plectus sambesii TaxID=2011161 RepID=A0A914USU1_9BILA